MRLVDANALDEVVLDLNTNRGFGITRCDYKMIDAVLFEFPTIEERKTGKWIHDGCDFEGGIDWMHCSECKHKDVWSTVTLTPYCPWCGCRMEGEQP